jgi:rubrerythrin
VARNVVALLDTCRAIELAHARVYYRLAELHAAHPTISALWRKTAREEEGHANQFQLGSGGAGGAVTGARVELGHAQQILQAVENLLVRLQSQSPSVVEALRLAIRMEEQLAQLHMDQVAIFERESSQKLFKAMMAADNGHIASLREALSRYEAESAG